MTGEGPGIATLHLCEDWPQKEDDMSEQHLTEDIRAEDTRVEHFAGDIETKAASDGAASSSGDDVAHRLRRLHARLRGVQGDEQ